ncbi:hypothetical protein T03_17161 [Trichinella britovi]|uniref:Uncharacterized protein n=1 Tax=Trichinella britovi TaxID=45882 RepID=A0A0V0Z214_TRIBR|nr:hypothetical protein T03_17161 [Trichinella britovi]
MFPAYYVFPLSTSVFSGPQINLITTEEFESMSN